MRQRKRTFLIIGVLAGVVGAVFASFSAAAAPAPAWTVVLNPLPANLAPGERTELLASATNVGGAPTTGESLLEVTLPPEVVPVEAKGKDSDIGAPSPVCEFDELTRKARCKAITPI